MNLVNFLFGWGDIKKDIALIVEGFVRSLFYTINSFVYEMIDYFYKIFILLCNGQLLDSEKLTNLFSRVGLLLGIVMSFRLALSFIQSSLTIHLTFYRISTILWLTQQHQINRLLCSTQAVPL